MQLRYQFYISIAAMLGAGVFSYLGVFDQKYAEYVFISVISYWIGKVPAVKQALKK